LVDKSLVNVEVDADAQRYRSLESTRQYAREALERNGELGECKAAHCAYYLGVARRIDHLFVHEGKSDEAYALATAEIDNYPAPLPWGIHEGHDGHPGCEMAACLSILWSRSLRFEGSTWLRAALRL